MNNKSWENCFVFLREAGGKATKENLIEFLENKL